MGFKPFGYQAGRPVRFRPRSFRDGRARVKRRYQELHDSSMMDFDDFCQKQTARLGHSLNVAVRHVYDAYEDCSLPAFENRR